MNIVDPLFSYLTVLAVIQPGRIQDIELYAVDILPAGLADSLVSTGALRTAHAIARDKGYVVQVRRGTYFLTAQGREVVRKKGLQQNLDNVRIFLMKDQRKMYK
jgi:hypothetical protein